MHSAPAGRVHFVPVDFERTDLAAALRARDSPPTCLRLSCEGVVSYLSPPSDR
jgi:O-methyltransferase involved in polyketide biosynthesis